MDIKNLTIAIIGGGLRRRRRRQGAQPASAPTSPCTSRPTEIREVGAGIGLRPSTMDLFRQWGIFDAIAAVSSPSDYFEILTATGDPIMPRTRGRAWTTTRCRPHPPDPPRRLHRRPARRAARGHGAASATSWRPSRTTATTPSLTFANGETVDRRPGDRRRRHQVDGPPAAVQRPGAGVRRRARLPRGHPRRRRPRAWSSTTTCACTSAAARRSTCCRCVTAGRLSFDITALDPDGTWAPAGDQGGPAATVEGFDERIVEHRPRPRHGHGQRPRGLRHRPGRHVAHRLASSLLGDAAHAMLPPPGPGRELGDHGRRRAGRRAAARRDSVPEALARYQADRKPVTDELQRISRQGWTRGRDRRRLPRPEAGGAGDADGAASRDRQGPRHPARAAAGSARPGGDARRRGGAGRRR